MAPKIDKAANILARGEVAVIPTDTIYGLVGLALRRQTVAQIYRLRKRNLKKPVIVLIARSEDVRHFGVKLAPHIKKILKKVWPGKVSVVLPISSNVSKKKFFYLHRGTGTIAFRLPRPAWLRNLLAATGPLAAPSANFERKPPAATVREAKKYFGKQAALYIDGGLLESLPSTLMKIENGKVVVLRRGAGKLPV